MTLNTALREIDDLMITMQLDDERREHLNTMNGDQRPNAYYSIDVKKDSMDLYMAMGIPKSD